MQTRVSLIWRINNVLVNNTVKRPIGITNFYLHIQTLTFVFSLPLYYYTAQLLLEMGVLRVVGIVLGLAAVVLTLWSMGKFRYKLNKRIT